MSNANGSVARLLQYENSERVIAFKPRYARALGGINEALFLQQLMYRTKGTPDDWFWHTAKQIEDETTLTEKQQRLCRSRLIALGVLEEQRKGTPAKLYFRVKWDTLLALLRAEANQDLTKGQNLNSPNGGTRPDQTAEHRRETKEEVKEKDIPTPVSPEPVVTEKPKKTPDLINGYRPFDVVAWWQARTKTANLANEGKAFANAKRILKAGITVPELDGLYDFCSKWMDGIDLGSMYSNIDKYRAAQQQPARNIHGIMPAARPTVNLTPAEKVLHRLAILESGQWANDPTDKRLYSGRNGETNLRRDIETLYRRLEELDPSGMEGGR